MGIEREKHLAGAAVPRSQPRDHDGASRRGGRSDVDLDIAVIERAAVIVVRRLVGRAGIPRIVAGARIGGARIGARVGRHGDVVLQLIERVDERAASQRHDHGAEAASEREFVIVSRYVPAWRPAASCSSHPG